METLDVERSGSELDDNFITDECNVVGFRVDDVISFILKVGEAGAHVIVTRSCLNDHVNVGSVVLNVCSAKDDVICCFV